jgi:acetyltransferase-like isoleucine patch superfamily enzyme
MKIGKNTFLKKCFVTWPHKVSIGKNCRLEHHVYFHHDGRWSAGRSIIIGDNVFIGSGCEFNIINKITVGEGCAIASGCRFIDHNHTDLLKRLPDEKGKEIILDAVGGCKCRNPERD